MLRLRPFYKLRNLEKWKDFTKYVQQISEGARTHTHQTSESLLYTKEEDEKMSKQQALLSSCSQSKGEDKQVNRFRKLCAREKCTISHRGWEYQVSNFAKRVGWEEPSRGRDSGVASWRMNRSWPCVQRRSWLCWPSNIVTHRCEKTVHNWELQMAQQWLRAEYKQAVFW